MGALVSLCMSFPLPRVRNHALFLHRCISIVPCGACNALSLTHPSPHLPIHHTDGRHNGRHPHGLHGQHRGEERAGVLACLCVCVCVSVCVRACVCSVIFFLSVTMRLYCPLLVFIAHSLTHPPIHPTHPPHRRAAQRAISSWAPRTASW